MFARRLQIQEELTFQIADALQQVTGAEDVGVIVEARHLCMMMRGVEKQNSLMKTSAMLGAFREKRINPSRVPEPPVDAICGSLTPGERTGNTGENVTVWRLALIPAALAVGQGCGSGSEPSLSEARYRLVLGSPGGGKRPVVIEAALAERGWRGAQ